MSLVLGGQRYVQNLPRSPPASLDLDTCHGQGWSPLNARVLLLSTPPPPAPSLSRGRSHCSSPDVPTTPPPPVLLQPLLPPHSHPTWRLARPSPDHAACAHHRRPFSLLGAGPGRAACVPRTWPHSLAFSPFQPWPVESGPLTLTARGPAPGPCTLFRKSQNPPMESVPRGQEEMWVVMGPAVMSPNGPCQPRDLVATSAWRAACYPSALGSDLSLLSGAQRGHLALGPGFPGPNTPQGPLPWPDLPASMHKSGGAPVENEVPPQSQVGPRVSLLG